MTGSMNGRLVGNGDAVEIILIAAKRMQQQVHSTCPATERERETRLPTQRTAQRKLQFTFMCRTFTSGIFHIFFKFNAHLVKRPPRNYVYLKGKQFCGP